MKRFEKFRYRKRVEETSAVIPQWMWFVCGHLVSVVRWPVLLWYRWYAKVLPDQI